MPASPRALALALVIAAPCAFAGDRLFPTDVLRNGEADATLDYTYFRMKVNGILGPSINAQFDTEEETLDLRFGLGDELQFGARAPYDSENRLRFTDTSGNTLQELHDKGFRNADVWLDYAFSSDPGFSLTGELQWDTKSAGDQDDGFEAGLVAGSELAPDTKAYGGVRYIYTRNDTINDAWFADAGLHYRLTPAVRLAPEAFYEYETGVGHPQSYGGRLSLIVQAGDAFYITPHAEYDSIDLGDVRSDSAWAAGLSFYALFGEVKRVAPKAAPAAATPPAATPPPAAPATPAPPATTPPAPAPVATPQPTPPPPPPKPVLEAGAKVTLPKAVSLYPRPVPTATPSATLGAGASATLKSKIDNASGSWWFVDCVGQIGWVREADLR